MKHVLQQIAAGDASAVDACLREYGGMVWRLASQYLSSRPQDVEDAVQEIFIDVWLSAHRFDPARGSEPGFVATIAHRRLTDRHRKLRSQESGHAAYVQQLPSPAPLSEPRDAGLPMSSAVKHLTPDEQQTLRLALERGLTHREISVATSVPIGTVKTRLRRAILRLQEVVRVGAGAHSNGGAA